MNIVFHSLPLMSGRSQSVRELYAPAVQRAATGQGGPQHLAVVAARARRQLELRPPKLQRVVLPFAAETAPQGR